jgi:lysophospholipase L1-like esterase
MWFPSDRLPSQGFVLNQGISGDTTAGVLQLLNRFGQTRPDRIHVMVGINDLRQGASDQAVLNNLRQIMRRLRQAHPQAQVVVHSILPTRLTTIPADRIASLNAQLSAITQHEGVQYLNLQTYFADEYGQLRQELTTDGLHLNPDGYAVWQSVWRQFSLV